MATQNQLSQRDKKYRTLADLINDLDEAGGRSALDAMRKKDVRQVSRSRLREIVHRAAGALQNEGIGKGERVVLWAENSPEWIMACLAVIRAGAQIVPLDVQLDRKALQKILADCQPNLILTGRNRLERLKELTGEIPEVFLIDRDETESRNLWNLEGEGALPEIDKNDGAALFYTSGTTGPPKGVPLTHENLVFQIDRILQTELATADDRILLPLPLHHVYPFVIGMLFPLAAKISIILPQSQTGPQILRAIKERKVTVICGVPRLYRALFEAVTERVGSRSEKVKKYFLRLVRFSSNLRLRFGWNAGKVFFYPLHRKIGPDLRLMASGGSLLDPNLGHSLAGLGWQVAIGYGLTETSPLLTINPPGSGRFDSVGQAIEGVEIKLDREEGGNGEEGEILVRGPSVFGGYFEMPEKTESAFAGDGWFRTGDLGILDDNGFLRIQGRVSTLIVTESGENIQPAEVEEAYGQSPQIREIGVLEEEGNLVALVVSEGGNATDREQMEEALSQVSKELPSYWQIQDFALTRQELPRTRLGKIRRHVLAERYREAKGGEGKEPPKEPLPLEEMSGKDRVLLENPSARTTWEWLAQRYGDQGLTPDSRLQSDLGIDSLEWLTVTVELGERTGIEISEEAIAEVETVRDLLEKIVTEEEGGRTFSGQPLDHPEEVLSNEQARWLEPPGWILSQVQDFFHAINRISMKTYFELKVSGLDKLPEEGCVFAPNHLSSLDPLALAAVLPPEVQKNTWWGGWTGIAFRNPLAKVVSRIGNAVPVDPDRAVISSLAFGAAVVRRKRNLVWFPEGQRSPDGDLRSFKPGIGMLLDRYPVPVVPVMIKGTEELLPVGRMMPKRGAIRIIFGPPRTAREMAQGNDSQERAREIAKVLKQDIQRMQENHGEG